jgi:hypothetical protein
MRRMPMSLGYKLTVACAGPVSLWDEPSMLRWHGPAVTLPVLCPRPRRLTRSVTCTVRGSSPVFAHQTHQLKGPLKPWVVSEGEASTPGTLTVQIVPNRWRQTCTAGRPPVRQPARV